MLRLDGIDTFRTMRDIRHVSIVPRRASDAEEEMGAIPGGLLAQVRREIMQPHGSTQ